MPFQNISPDPKDEYFADGLTEELISTMAKISGLRVIARTSVMGYKVGQKKIDEIARELRVGTILEGSVRKAGDKLRITAQLIDAESSDHLWSESYDREMKDVFMIQSEISQTVAEALKVKLLPTEKERVEKKPTNNVKAYELFLRGLETAPWVTSLGEWTEENIERSREYFERAVELDPNFALAYAHLESCYMEAYTYKRFDERAPKAEAAARKAMELDPNLAESHFALADTKWHSYDFDGWEKEMKLTIELKPNYAGGHFGLGLHHLLVGAFDEAEVEMRRARELDPTAPLTRYFFRVLLYVSHQFDRAVEETAEEIKLHDRPDLHDFLAGIYLARGDYEKALIESKKAVAASGPEVRPRCISTLACIYAKTGRKEDATKILKELEELSRQSATVYDFLADIYFCLGDYDEAFGVLERAYDEHSEYLPFSLINPLDDKLRFDPRFIALRKKVGLENS